MMGSEDLHIAVTGRKRHPTLWFDDGNIILTTNVSLFRVHRGLLSMNSPVFADMLAMPQPDRMEDSFEDLPIVEINDNDTDFTHLLCFFYDRRYYQGGTQTTFEKISGLLRMSTKYQMDDLRNEIISHLSVAYPSTFEKYSDAVDSKTQLRLFPPFHGQHFAVVALARKSDASILLPAALWRSMCMTTRDIEEGIEDSTRTKHSLSPMDAKLCVRHKHHSYKLWVQIEHVLPNVLVASECVRSDPRAGNVLPCRELARFEIMQYQYFATTGPAIRDDHDLFTEMNAFEMWRPLVCDGCRRRLIQRFLFGVRMSGAPCLHCSISPNGTAEETPCPELVCLPTTEFCHANSVAACTVLARNQNRGDTMLTEFYSPVIRSFDIQP
ncbi:hypothetical protein BD410DRAFT_776924 [Rickenella mellea]|uniref:BTB domain-containing protein n=1 Tax=Rickenella mellea TaxID=50990 RepID=A0A4Y7PQA6_9AGAM|nr:hypothetical protein BD410DRAFT_776924 [Rickenella mellea]